MIQSYRVPSSPSFTLRLVPILLGLVPILPALDVSVTDYSPKKDGVSDDTIPIQKAIDACAKAGGGHVTVPAGTFMVAGLQLRSKVALVLAKEATLLGAPRLADYTHGANAFIYADTQDQVTIEGEGTLDGNGSNYWVKKVNYVWDRPAWMGAAHDEWTDLDRPANLRFEGCTNLTITGVTIVNSPTWTININSSNVVRISGITIRNPSHGPNTDGIDLVMCQDVVVDHCDISTGDDGVVIKSKRDKDTDPKPRLSRDITVSNCSIETTCQALKIGTETQGDFTNIKFLNCYVYNRSDDLRERASAGVAIETVDGGKVDNVEVRNITMDNVRSPLFVRLGNRGDGQIPTVKVPGAMSNVTVDGIKATRCFMESSITGIPGYRVDGITLRNVDIELEGGGLASWATVTVPEKIAVYPAPRMFGIRLPASGLYCRHVKGLTLDAVHVSQRTPEGRPTLIFDDVVDANGQMVQAPVPVNRGPSVAVAATAKPLLGTSSQVSVLGSDDGSEPLLTYAWSVIGTPPAPVAFVPNRTNAAKNAVATFIRAGSYALQVAITDAAGLTTSSTVTVQVDQALTAMTVSPATPSVMSGQTQAFSAAGSDQFGQPMAVTPAWSVSGGGTISSTGVFTASTAGGPFTVSGSANGRTATASVTVTAPLNVAPTVVTAAAASPVTATSASLSVGANDDHGEMSLIYTWSTVGTPPAPVTFSANGTNAAKKVTATFTKAGTYAFQVVIADAAGLTTSSTVTVPVAQSLASMSISPTTASVVAGRTRAFLAAGLDQFGSSMSVVPIWAVTGGGTIGADGVFTASTAGGPFTVTGSANGRSGSASVSVTLNAPPKVTTAAAAASNPLFESSTTLSVGANDDNGESNLTYKWSTTGTPPAPVTFSANGTNAAKKVTATFTKPGVYGFRVLITDADGVAALSAMSVTVTPGLTAMKVTPATASVMVGQTQTVSAVGLDQFGALMTGTATDPYSWAPTRQWVVSSGVAANVAFAQANAVNTGVIFSAPGTYGLKLRVTDARSMITESPEIQVMVGLNINFQPANVAVPAGYVADTGALYGSRNGLTYGWNADISADARKRNANPDPVLDTFIHVAKNGPKTWEIALPAGLYEVEIDAGDPSYTDMTNSFDIEGQQQIDLTPQTGNYDRYTALVQVTDGRLTIRQATTGVNAKLVAVRIKPVPGGNG